MHTQLYAEYCHRREVNMEQPTKNSDTPEPTPAQSEDNAVPKKNNRWGKTLVDTSSHSDVTGRENLDGDDED